MKKCMHKIENMPLQPSSIYFCPWQMSQSAFFPVKTFCVVHDSYRKPRACHNLGNAPGLTNARPPGSAKQMPQPRDWQGGQMPRSSPGGALGALLTLYITDLDHEVVSGSQLTRFCVEGFKTSTRAAFGNRRAHSTHYALGSDKFLPAEFRTE